MQMKVRFRLPYKEFVPVEVVVPHPTALPQYSCPLLTPPSRVPLTQPDNVTPQLYFGPLKYLSHTMVEESRAEQRRG